MTNSEQAYDIMTFTQSVHNYIRYREICMHVYIYMYVCMYVCVSCMDNSQSSVFIDKFEQVNLRFTSEMGGETRFRRGAS